MTPDEIKASLLTIRRELDGIITSWPDPAPPSPPSLQPPAPPQVMNGTLTMSRPGIFEAPLPSLGRLLMQANVGLDYKAWITPRESSVSLTLTVVDHRADPDVTRQKPLAFEAAAYEVRLPLPSPVTSLRAGLDGQVVSTSDPTALIYQTGAFNYVDGALQPFTLRAEVLGQIGSRWDGWCRLLMGQHSLTVCLRHAWQQFPKGVRIDGAELVLELHPARATTESPPAANLLRYTRPQTMYFRREGGAKTYRILLSSETDLDPVGLNSVWQGPPTLPPVMPTADAASLGYDTHLMNDLYIPSFQNKQASGGWGVLYGWRDFGDRLHPGWADTWGTLRVPGFYNGTHFGAEKFFRQYLRTGDLRWFTLGEIETLHFEQDVAHGSTLGYWKHDFGPGEVRCNNHDNVDHGSRNIHPGHMHVSGLADYVLLTGDPRSTELLRLCGDWWVRAKDTFFPVPAKWPHWAEAERDFSEPLSAMNDCFRALRDSRYHAAAAQIVSHLVSWWQIPQPHLQGTTTLGMNEWTAGTGWWTMYPKMDNAPGAGWNGCNPQWAGRLFTALIRWLQADQPTFLVEHPLVEEMIRQCLNYVVKWGFTLGVPRYAEGSPTTVGLEHLAYPLAYAAKVLLPKAPHPEWYDTKEQWLPLAKAHADGWAVVKPRGTMSDGDYGYGWLPHEFWDLMKA